MSGEVPEIYWYLFWVAVLAWAIVFALSMMTLIHRYNMKTLDLLRFYAEKGLDPPPALTELIAKSTGDAERKWKSSSRGARLQSFMNMLFMAAVAGGVTWWRIDEGGPQAVIYVFGAAAVLWTVSALGLLAAALFTPEK